MTRIMNITRSFLEPNLLFEKSKTDYFFLCRIYYKNNNLTCHCQNE